MSKKKKGRRFGANVARTAERDSANQSKGFSYLKLPKGLKLFKETPSKKSDRTRLDIIPYIVTDERHPDYIEDDPESAVVGELWYRRPIQIHRNIGAEGESVICPKTVHKKCPICEEKDRQYKEGVDSKDVIGKSSFRSLYYVVPKNNKDHEEEPHVWDISQYCFGDELNAEVEENPEFGKFPDLEDGLTLNIRFSEEAFGKNKFAKANRIDFKKRKEGYSEDILKGLPSLDEIFEVRSYKDLQKLFFEMGEEEEEEEEDKLPFDTDDDDEPKRKKKNGKNKEKDKKKKKGYEVDDTRPSPDFSRPPKKKKEEPEEEEEEEKPKKGKKGKKDKKGKKKG